MKELESIDTTNDIKNKTVIILGYGQIWQYFYQILKKNWCKSLVISKRKWDHISDRNTLPIKIEEVDYIINTYKVPDIKQATTEIPEGFKWKILYIQNGFNIREIVAEMWIQDILFAVLNISVKRESDWKLWTKILKESPISGEWSRDIIALFNGPYHSLFKESDNFDRDVAKKWIINSIFNPLSIIYNKTAKEAIDTYWFKQLKNLANEILSVVNCWCNPEIEKEELWEYIMNVYENFWEDFPNTHQDFYEKVWDEYIMRNSIKKNEIDNLLWYLLIQARKFWIACPLIEEIYDKIQQMEHNQLNKNLT